MLPFHFLRLMHLYYTWYFVVPLFCWYGVKIYDGGEAIFGTEATLWRRGLHACALMGLACFGVYYAWFGCLALLVGAVLASVRQRSRRPFYFGIAAIFFVGAGVMANLAPNALLINQYGKNEQIARRLPAESELYGLKIVQMILPRPEHRSVTLASINEKYSNTAPNVNENRSSTLGVIGTLGFLLLLYCAMVYSTATDGRSRRLLHYFGVVTVTMVLVATVGGFSALFSQLVTPLIRGWNRISIFIAFMSLAAIAIAVDRAWKSRGEAAQPRALRWVLLLVIGCIGFWDQTAPANLADMRRMQAAYFNDAAFFRSVEQSLPAGSAIYQLPFMRFPEAPNKEGLISYDLGKGFLHSRTTKWSYGCAAGRDGCEFLDDLAKQPLLLQLEVARFLGFAGVFVDRRGYKDHATDLIAEMDRHLAGATRAEDEDRSMIFYSLVSLPAVEFEDRLSPAARFLLRKWGIQKIQNVVSVAPQSPFQVDFTRPLASQLRSTAGMSDAEPWGSWSDARIVTLRFKKALPRRFVLNVVAKGFGPNVGLPVRVRIGPQTSTFIPQSHMESFGLPFALDTEQDSVEFTVPAPTSPSQLGASVDQRLLGLGIEAVSIRE